MAFPPPRILRATREIPPSRRAVQACPAVNGFERRIIEILAPFSVQIRCKADSHGQFNFHLIESGTRIDQELIPQLVSFMPRDIWRSKSAPVVQVALPHVFVTDEPTYLTQMPAWASPDAISLPGMLISGRFPADVWPRSLNLAFEWTDLSRDFKMKRGQPICYLFPETADPLTPIHLMEGVMTEELKSYLMALTDVVKYTSGTFELMDRAREMRPKTLVSGRDL